MRDAAQHQRLSIHNPGLRDKSGGRGPLHTGGSGVNRRPHVKGSLTGSVGRFVEAVHRLRLQSVDESDHRQGGVATPAESLKPEKTSPPRVEAKLPSIVLALRLVLWQARQ
jgi:hypothetical protein